MSTRIGITAKIKSAENIDSRLLQEKSSEADRRVRQQRCGTMFLLTPRRSNTRSRGHDSLHGSCIERRLRVRNTAPAGPAYSHRTDSRLGRLSWLPRQFRVRAGVPGRQPAEESSGIFCGPLHQFHDLNRNGEQDGVRCGRPKAVDGLQSPELHGTGAGRHCGRSGREVVRR